MLLTLLSALLSGTALGGPLSAALHFPHIDDTEGDERSDGKHDYGDWHTDDPYAVLLPKGLALQLPLHGLGVG